MISAVKISIITILGGSILFANTDMIKKYDIKSGKIEYSIKESGDIMGMVKIRAIGKKRVIFDNYGAKDLSEESKVKKETSAGQTKVNKTHTLTYLNNGITYNVNFKQKNIVRMKNKAMAMAALFGDGKNAKQSGEAMLKSMGGKKIGTDKVLNYSCDIWDLMGIKQCIYKGIPLRIESNIMGLKSLQIATKAQFNIDLNEKDFNLPQYPFVDMYGKRLNLDRNKLNEIDKKESQADSQEMKEGMKAMAVAMSTLKESGFDVNNPNAKITKAQEKSMQDAIIAAMGGEEQMLAKTKQEIFEEAKDLPQIKKCFQNANSVKEANICEMKADSEDPEQHTKWNEKIKAKLLKEINNFEKSIPCIEKASSFEALKQCML
jgi:hypothetical protein